MKKLSVFICLLFVTICSFAQLNVMGEFKGQEKIATIRATYSYLYQTSSGYEFVAKTDNRFDNLFYFFLGENAEDAIQTTTDLLNLVENKDFENAIVTNKDKQCHIYKLNMLGTSCLVFKGDGYAGESNIGKNELKKIIKKLSSLKTSN